MVYTMFDYTWFIFMVPCMILSLYCSAKVHSTFNKYSQVRNRRGLTGAQAAQNVLYSNGVTGVTIEKVAGNLTDHFDPRTNTIRLSESVYDSSSVAAVGVAAHEAGHAVQHATNYVPNKIRSAVVPAAKFGSSLSWILITIGLFLPVQYDFVVIAGIVLFSFSVIFTLVTLPVEFNASKRALQTIKGSSLLDEAEFTGAKKTLSAAAMTYVAAAATSIASLLRLLLIVNNRRR
ncbi:MAG: zinc metallopeptidase [Eubacteriales bacterium]|nr:zinc metallopeptidase [Eubacteriales bacterium]